MILLSLFLIEILTISKGSTCGVPDIKPNTDYRIVGGSTAKPHSWPWQVSLLNRYKMHMCGASIIDNKWILTAAHCYVDPKNRNEPLPYYVRVGDHDVSAYVVEPYQQDFVIANVYIHPNYNYKTNNHDIAVLKLAKPITYNKHVKPICLPKSNKDPKTGTICYTTGWGSTILDEVSNPWGWLGNIFGKKSVKRDDSRYLNQVGVPVLMPEACRQTKYDYSDITDHMICAGLTKGKKDACQGDSGGPLVCQETDDTWIQYGVTSWGYGCGAAGYPGIYARVTRYYSWIENVKTKYG